MDINYFCTETAMYYSLLKQICVLKFIAEMWLHFEDRDLNIPNWGLIAFYMNLAVQSCQIYNPGFKLSDGRTDLQVNGV
jgi:hypothetical protein